jgi:hypothetical protein
VTWTPKRGDVVNVAAGNKQDRPGVIFWVEDTGVLTSYFVAWGTGTDPEQRRKNGDAHSPNVSVEKGSPDGQALALDKDTWFYPGERGPFELAAVAPRPGASPCPRRLLDNLTRLHRGR